MIEHGPDRIDRFAGEHFWLSNFYASPIRLGGVVYPTAEHAFQAAKTLDPDEREKIAKVSTPGAAKRLGRQVALRPGWDELRLDVMRAIIAQKFRRDGPLAGPLLGTGDALLVEGNTWGDRYWGVDARTGRGRNQLGHMRARVDREIGYPFEASRTRSVAVRVAEARG